MKPGHWATGTQRMRAVYQEFVGQQRLSVVNRRGSPYPVDGTPLALESTRPVALAKGRPKEIETTFLAPQTSDVIEVRNDLVERGFGRTLPSREPLTRMPPYQYYFVVLAKEPNRYALLKTLDSVSVPWDGETEADDTEDPLDYRVVSLPVERTILLSDNPLTWTSIAYVLWDDVDPKLFTPGQERALVDWLHWGGQLVVSGPDSLDLFKGSFLEPYLPATSGGSRSDRGGRPGDLNRELDDVDRPRGGRPLAPKSPWSGIELVDRDRQKVTQTAGRQTGGLLRRAARRPGADRRVGDAAAGARAGELEERLRELGQWRHAAAAAARVSPRLLRRVDAGLGRSASGRIIGSTRGSRPGCGSSRAIWASTRITAMSTWKRRAVRGSTADPRAPSAGASGRHRRVERLQRHGRRRPRGAGRSGRRRGARSRRSS